MKINKNWDDYVTAAKCGVVPMLIATALVVSEYLNGEAIPIWVIALCAPAIFLVLGFLFIDIVRKNKKNKVNKKLT